MPLQMIGIGRPGKHWLALLVVACLGLAAPGARAARSAQVVTPRTTATMLAETDAYEAGKPFRLALRLVLAPGWHAYWHNPGDAGVAPSFDPVLPEAGLLGDLTWPLPVRIADGSAMSFGYTDTLMLVRSVTLPAGGPATITASANWLVCATVCIPEHGNFVLTLPPGTAAASAEAGAFDGISIPSLAPWPVHIAPDGTLWIADLAAQPAVFLPDAADTTVLGAAQNAHVADGALQLSLTPTALFHADQPLSGLLVLGRGAGRRGFILTATPQALPGGGGLPWSTLALAFVGGLLLNLMPCVFPILAMKTLGLARLTGHGRRTVRLHALSYTAGVLLSFAALAVLLGVLRHAGAAAGWGFQFQYPAFVAIMAWLFFVIGLNLSGFFTLSGSWTGAGSGLASKGGHAGSLATGLLAVLVATPCAAPFMGVAIAAAAGATPGTAAAIFLALGLGFAFPYLVLAAWPNLARLLPAPGPWMEHLRQFLAFPVYAATVWLVWVLDQEAGPAGLLVAGSGLVLIALGLWLGGLGAGLGTTGRRVSQALTVACILAACGLLAGIGHGTTAVTQASAEAYSPDRLQQLRTAGQPVLVDMTAAWCVTCLVNERVAIHPALPALAGHHVVYLTGDWTRQDPGITDFLRQYGRDGVPLYVFFPANQPGQVLPQILTPALVARLGS